MIMPDLIFKLHLTCLTNKMTIALLYVVLPYLSMSIILNTTRMRDCVITISYHNGAHFSVLLVHRVFHIVYQVKRGIHYELRLKALNQLAQLTIL